jgi:uncharacterized phage-associated protein
MSSAKSVAKELIQLSLLPEPIPELLTHYRLQCLDYYAQAWSLVLRDSELFPDEIECLEEGPAVPAIREALHNGPLGHIVKLIPFELEPVLDQEDEAQFLSCLWASYNNLYTSGMWTLMQAEGPFRAARERAATGGKGLINMNELRDSFSRRADIPAPLGEYGRQRRKLAEEAQLTIRSSPPLDVEAIWKPRSSVTPSTSKG